MKEYKPRNLEEVANKIIKVIEEKCDFNEGRIIDIIEQIEKEMQEKFRKILIF